ncbi:ankyrin repeat domain protein [Nitzschia inconspicua]|uniref:Ankyrin repeat domain protein n=1 Tax=Nitzschia inconspicua TaxID=303405 RepID=A0A9K3Q507_9STRA|nr:ankyrin repeat domain protein [Nitzschia inconspicua]
MMNDHGSTEKCLPAPEQRPPPSLDGVYGGTELHRLARRNEWTMLLASFDIEKAKILNEHYRTPLHYAIEQGTAPDEVVLELIRIAPFQIRVKDVSGSTPLHLGCQFGIGLAVVEYMLEMDDLLTSGDDNKSIVTMRNNDNKIPLQIFKLSQKMSRAVKKLLDTDWSCNFWKHHREEFVPVLLTLTAASPLEEEHKKEAMGNHLPRFQNRISQSGRQLSARLSQVVTSVKERQRQQQRETEQFHGEQRRNALLEGRRRLSAGVATLVASMKDVTSH